MGIVAACLVVLGPASFAVGLFVLRRMNQGASRDPALMERYTERNAKAKGLKQAVLMAQARPKGVGRLEGTSRI